MPQGRYLDFVFRSPKKRPPLVLNYTRHGTKHIPLNDSPHLIGVRIPVNNAFKRSSRAVSQGAAVYGSWRYPRNWRQPVDGSVNHVCNLATMGQRQHTTEAPLIAYEQAGPAYCYSCYKRSYLRPIFHVPYHARAVEGLVFMRSSRPVRSRREGS